MENDKKTFTVSWPFWQCQAIMPKATGNDVFVWLYLSLLVHENQKDKKENPLAYSEKAKAGVRTIMKEKFPQTMDDNLIHEIEEKIDLDFTEVVNERYGNKILKKDVIGFLDSFEYLFSNDVEVKTIYKDAVTGAILPFFKDADSPKRTDVDFTLRPLAKKEPSNGLVQKALKLSVPMGKASDPLTPQDSVDSLVLEFDPEEETYFDDTLSFDEEVDDKKDPETYADIVKTKEKRTIRILDGSYSLQNYTITASLDTNGDLSVEQPLEFPINKATSAWFSMIFRRAYMTNEEFAKKVDEVLPRQVKQEPIANETMQELFSSRGQFKNCQKLYDSVSHSKTLRAELQLETIHIEDNFTSLSGFFYVGRFLDYLGRTIPDTTIRDDSLDEFRLNMRAACANLGISEGDCWKLTNESIWKEYTRNFKNPDRAPFKALFANAILNNISCSESQFFYKEVVQDAWYLYDSRSKVDHPNGNPRLSMEDVEKLVKVAKFIISIQGGKTL